MTTLEELGARAWINHYPVEVRVKNLDTDPVLRDSAAIDQFCHTAELQRSQLRDYGRTVRNRGYAKKMAYKEVAMPWDETVRVLRTVKSTWNRVDGRVPQSKDDTTNRYLIGPRWSNNSCALDAAIFCGLRLDAGRIEADQLSLLDMAQLRPVASMFRNVLMKEWGNMSTEVRMEMRDCVRTGLVVQHPQAGTITSFLPISTVVDACFEGLPQLTYTDVSTRICCDGRPAVNTPNGYQRKHFLELSKSALDQAGTVQAALERHFGQSPLNPGALVTPCTNGTNCELACRKLLTIVDRMPPVLMVGLDQTITLELEKRRRAFQTLRFKTQILGEWIEVQYEPLGCVMYHPTRSHFTARWLADRPGEDSRCIVCHDGLDGEAVFYVNHWADVAPRLPKAQARTEKVTQGPLIMFYRKIA